MIESLRTIPFLPRNFNHFVLQVRAGARAMAAGADPATMAGALPALLPPARPPAAAASHVPSGTFGQPRSSTADVETAA